MHFALKALAALVGGVVLGLAFTWLILMRDTSLGDQTDGPWHTSPYIGTAKGGLYMRAAVALHGLFALSKSETLYYTTTTDSEGSPLHGACTYKMFGHDMNARWWSVTAYGADDFLIANPRHIYSISKTTVHRKPDGNFEVEISPHPGADNWIPVISGPFSLTVRLYNPGPDAVADPKRVPLPVLHRWACT